MIKRSVFKGLKQVSVAWLCAGAGWLIVESCVATVREGRLRLVVSFIATTVVVWIAGTVMADNPRRR
jgi:hypothetical protein